MTPTGKLRFIYTSIHEILGAKLPKDRETVLIGEPGAPLWACLTRAPGIHCKDIDQGSAVSIMLLRPLAGGGPTGTFAERLAAETEAALADAQHR